MRSFICFLVTLFTIANCYGQEFYHQSVQLKVEGTFGFPLWDGSGGISCADFNNDGLDDLTFATESGDDIIFLENKGDEFELVNPPFVSNTFESKQVIWLDYEGDGDKDLFVTTWDSYNYLYENDGNMNFTDVTASVNLPTTNANTFGANFTDFNGDGLLELYISNYGFPTPQANEMYTYNATTHAFDDVTTSSNTGNGLRQSFCNAVFDYDGDGDLDFYIANDRPQFENTLYMNMGGLFFIDVSVPSNTNIGVDAMNSGVGDGDMDGDIDIYVTNGLSSGGAFAVYLENNGNSTFTDVAATNGTIFDRLGWAGSFVDYDNDRDEDLYVSTSSGEPSALFVNDGTGNFTEPLFATNGLDGRDTISTFSNACGDFNNDGRYDFVLGHGFVSEDFSLFLNHEKNNNNYIKLKLEGTDSHVDAFGAVVETWINEIKTVSLKHSTNGFLGQHSDYLNIGIGTATAVDSLIIKWPFLGSIEHIPGTDLLVNGTSHIIENSGVSSTYSNPICLFNHSIAVNPVASQNYGAEFNLDCDSKILNGANVLFQAENEILLDIDFEVEQGATFEAEIDVCGN